ncbi:calcium-binding protein [Roseomonas marmotae]|uniref:Calcium-binding protein n=1 Tax=Roseomonas marmotae TaxID=2768161 RepID=A0ABS3KLB3_9PROT|nr:calcium-binding protein [Roseomonas marmotae]MBO1077358.1 calcium-binding protein [Roseomonas marmotae]QTI81216.1 calcium-binding protein [Roseomonas marmotae]
MLQQNHQLNEKTSMTLTPLSLDDLDQVVGGVFRQGTAGHDTVEGSSEADVIFGGAGNDMISTGAGNDQAYGEAGNDFIHTGAGNDLAFGGDGNDTLNGGAGADQLHGEAGNDFLDGGAGDRAADLAFGGAGNDTYIWAPGDGNDMFHGGAGHDTLNVLGMSRQDLERALTLDGQTALQMQVNDNVVTFTDAHGQPATFGGVINYGGETLRFTEVEQIRLG